MKRGSGGRRRLGRIVVALAGAAVLLALTASVAAADCGNTAVAVVQGPWQMHGTTTFSGNPPSGLKDHSGTDQLFFTSTCSGPANCTLLAGSLTDHTNSNSSAYFGGNSGFVDATALTQSGSDYSVHFPDIGFGGQNLPPCRPPLLGYTVHLHVVAAVQDSSGTWQPTYITGTEDSLGWWTCNGSTGVPSSLTHVALTAVPAGRSFPSSAAGACPQVPTPRPVVAAVQNPGPGTQNPQQSTISTGLAAPASAFQSFGHAAGNALITLGIVLFITFPATLFNKTLEENYDDIRDIAQRRFGWLSRLSKRVAAGATAAGTRSSSGWSCWSALRSVASTTPTSASTRRRCSRTAR